MANGIPLRIGSQPSLLGSFASGRQFKQQQQAAEAQAARNTQLQGLLGQLTPQIQPQLAAGVQGPADPLQTGGVVAAAGNRRQALAQLAVDFPERFEQVNANLGIISQQQKDEAADFAFDLRGTPIDQRSGKIQARVRTLRSQGRNASDTASLEELDESQQNEALDIAQIAALSPEKRIDLARGEQVTPTSLVKNLEAAGLVQGTPEFQQAVLESVTKPATQVTIGGAGKEQEELAKLRAQDLSSIRAKGDVAETELANLDILESIDITTGKLEPAKLALASFAEGFGIDASAIADVASGEAFTAQSGKLVLKVLERQKGPQTDADRNEIRKTMAQLGSTPGANAFINSSARAFARRNVEQRNFFDNFLSQNDTLKGAQKSWNDFKRDTPMVSRNVRTPEGLPVFFFRFRDRVQQANPDASNQDIIQAWRDQEAAAGAK